MRGRERERAREIDRERESEIEREGAMEDDIASSMRVIKLLVCRTLGH